MTKTPGRFAHVLIIFAAFTAISVSARSIELRSTLTPTWTPTPTRGGVLQHAKTDSDAAMRSARVTSRSRIIGYWTGTRCT